MRENLQKEIQICMLHNDVKNEEDIYRYLYFNDEMKNKINFVWNEENPDYLIATENIYTDKYMWEKFVKLYEKATIFVCYNRESVFPDFNIFDYAIAFDRNLKYDDRVCRIPTRLFYGNYIFERENSLYNKEELIKEEITNRKFCNYIYSNDLAHHCRTEIFHVLNKYKKVDSWGNYLHNVEGTLNANIKLGYRPMIQECIEVKGKYKFSVAFENATYNGYTSEKIYSSLEAHTVPIYWGNPKIEEEINPAAFINCHKFNDFNEVLEEVKRIDNDDELWCKMVCSPWMTTEQINREQEEINNYYNFIENLFLQPLNQAKRKGEGCRPDSYQKWFLEKQTSNARLQGYYEVTMAWVRNMREGIGVTEYLKVNGYKKVAIYGMAYIGVELYEQIKNVEGITVLYGIDQGNPKIPVELKCYKIDELEGKETPDVIIITLPHLYDAIVSKLKKFYQGEVISIKKLFECRE